MFVSICIVTFRLHFTNFVHYVHCLLLVLKKVYMVINSEYDAIDSEFVIILILSYISNLKEKDRKAEKRGKQKRKKKKITFTPALMNRLP